MKTIALCLVMIMAQATVFADHISDRYFKETDAFLKKYVKNGLIDYDKIGKEEFLLLNTHLAMINVDMAGMQADERKAFLLNAYNMLVIKAINDNYPVNSPMDVAGFFDKKVYRVGGIKMTLNDLENKHIRAEFNDARIHFALVCAAVSCPPITDIAFTADNVEERLELLTKQALNNPEFIRVSADGTKVELSEIFRWYKEDFGTDEAGVIAYINKYRETPIPATAKVGYYTYDWTLNKVQN